MQQISLETSTNKRWNKTDSKLIFRKPDRKRSMQRNKVEVNDLIPDIQGERKRVICFIKVAKIIQTLFPIILRCQWIPRPRESETGFEKKRTSEGGRDLTAVKGKNGGIEEPPLLAVRWARQIGWLIPILMHLCQQGHLVVSLSAEPRISHQ